MEWLNLYLIETLLITGLALLAIEILVLGFATFFLFFLGLSFLIIGGLVFINVMPNDVLLSLAAIAVCTGLLAVGLWKPLQKMQKSVKMRPTKNDFVGHSFVLTHKVSPVDNPNYQYSGISWKLMSDQEIEAGQWVIVTSTEVGIFHVIPKP